MKKEILILGFALILVAGLIVCVNYPDNVDSIKVKDVNSFDLPAYSEPVDNSIGEVYFKEKSKSSKGCNKK